MSQISALQVINSREASNNLLAGLLVDFRNFIISQGSKHTTVCMVYLADIKFGELEHNASWWTFSLVKG